ncbi:hypothetical protein KSF78_0000335 [Schistosoma japonicum]|nr:hypothetical protein KSF78_0000335 [Schistosoma japonicum]KAH8849878.1 hypothetical protein KSF78_0000335 [Schistosoma japonicum]
MNYASPLVTINNYCDWCASLTIGSPLLTIKGCSSTCRSDSFLKKYVTFNYTCCNTNYCNSSSKICSTHKMLFISLLIIFIYLNTKK